MSISYWFLEGLWSKIWDHRIANENSKELKFKSIDTFFLSFAKKKITVQIDQEVYTSCCTWWPYGHHVRSYNILPIKLTISIPIYSHNYQLILYKCISNVLPSLILPLFTRFYVEFYANYWLKPNTDFSTGSSSLMISAASTQKKQQSGDEGKVSSIGITDETHFDIETIFPVEVDM